MCTCRHVDYSNKQVMTMGEAPITHVTHVLNKNSNIQWRPLNVICYFLYYMYKELLTKGRIRSLWEQILSFKRRSQFEKGLNWKVYYLNIYNYTCSYLFLFKNPIMFGFILKNYLSSMLWQKFHEIVIMQTRNIFLWIHVLFVYWKTQNFSEKYYTIIDFNEVDIRIYLPEKVIIHRGR